MEHITYLIANYNCARYVARCIESLARQTSSHWRAVICDDASGDDSIAVITTALRDLGLEDRISMVRKQRNEGYISALKTLIQAATTDIVGILDADDELFPEATTLVLAEYARDPNAAFVYSRYVTVDGDSREIPFNSPVCSPVPAGRTALIYGFIGALRTFRRTAYGKTAGFDDGMLYAEDRDLVYKLEEVAAPVFIDASLYKYRFVRGSQSTDERKYRAGIQNHVAARQNALKRRDIGGTDLLIHRAINSCMLARSRPRTFICTAAARHSLKLLTRAVQILDLNAGRIKIRQ